MAGIKMLLERVLSPLIHRIISKIAANLLLTLTQGARFSVETFRIVCDLWAGRSQISFGTEYKHRT